MDDPPFDRRQNTNNTPITWGLTLFSLLILLGAISLTASTVLLYRLHGVAETNKRNSAYLIECTTPGPGPPPDTGHKCFDDGQARTGDAVTRIVDSNGNGIADIQDLADALGVTLSKQEEP